MRIGNFACIRLVRQHGGLSNAVLPGNAALAAAIGIAGGATSLPD
jgi:hypothetical protein